MFSRLLEVLSRNSCHRHLHSQDATHAASRDSEFRVQGEEQTHKVVDSLSKREKERGLRSITVVIALLMLLRMPVLAKLQRLCW